MFSQKQSGVLLSYVNLIAKNLIVLVYTPVLLRYLGQSQYGLYQMINSVISSLTILDMGFGSAYIRFYAKAQVSNDKDAEKKLNGLYLLIFLGLALVSVFVGSVLVMLNSTMFGRTLNAEELNTTRALMLLMTINVAITFISSVFDSNIMAHSQFKFQRSRQLFQTILTPILTIPLLIVGMKSIAIVIVQSSVTILFLFLNTRFALRVLGMRFQFHHLNFSLFHQVFVFSFFIFLNQIIDQINWNVPSFLLGMFSGARDVAVFAIANQIKNLFISLSTTLSGVFAPEINTIVTTTNDNMALTHIMTSVGRMQSFILTYVLGGFIILGPFFISVWAGPSYSDAYWLSLILIIPFYVTLVQNTGYEIIRAKNIHQFRAVVELVFALVNIMVTIWAIKEIGLFGSTIGTVLTMVLVSWLTMNWFYQRRAGLDMFFFWKRIATTLVPSIISTTICWAITIKIPVSSFTLFILLGIVYSVIFFCLMFLVLDKKEKNKIQVMFHIRR